MYINVILNNSKIAPDHTVKLYLKINLISIQTFLIKLFIELSLSTQTHSKL